MNYSTKILHNGNETEKITGALSIPIFNASTYHQREGETSCEYDYSRSGNPTRKALENTIAALENAKYGYAFSSGMAATSSVIAALVQTGDHIIATQDIYGGSFRILNSFFSKFGISTDFIDMTDISNIQKVIKPNTKLILIETPSNPLLKITDISAVAELAKSYKIITAIDNTFQSPYFQKPIDLGIDISIHSATKFLGGHSDVIAGLAVTDCIELAKKIYFVQNGFGAILNPQDCWLVMRGIKTLRARMELQQESAIKIARWLLNQEWVTEVYYPGLETHKGYDIIKKQASGFGCVLSFKTKNVEIAQQIMQNVKLWAVAVSLGGVESILSYPAKMSHASIPKTVRDKLGITENLLRLSVGLEDSEDLINDLKLKID